MLWNLTTTTLESHFKSFYIENPAKCLVSQHHDPNHFLALLHAAVIASVCSCRSAISSVCCPIQTQPASLQNGTGSNLTMNTWHLFSVFFIFWTLNMIMSGFLFTIFTQYTISPPPLRPISCLSSAPSFPSLSSCKFDSGPRTGSSPRG